MRGMPSADVKCRICGRSPAWERCQMCRGCISRTTRGGYRWTEEQDTLVRRTYAVGTKKELQAALNYATGALGRSRSTISRRAVFLGCGLLTRRTLWAPHEIDLLERRAGVWSVNELCRRLKRSPCAVMGKISRMGISRSLASGYSQRELSMLLGSSERAVRRHIQEGTIAVRNGRISEHSVCAFLHQHPEAYSLKRVDELWFKDMLFAGARCFVHKVYKEAA